MAFGFRGALAALQLLVNLKSGVDLKHTCSMYQRGSLRIADPLVTPDAVA